MPAIAESKHFFMSVDFSSSQPTATRSPVSAKWTGLHLIVHTGFFRDEQKGKAWTKHRFQGQTALLTDLITATFDRMKGEPARMLSGQWHRVMMIQRWPWHLL